MASGTVVLYISYFMYYKFAIVRAIQADCLANANPNITSHHNETTDAGLDGLCIREISVYHTNL